MRTHQRSWLRGTLVAAVVLSVLPVPHGVAYAELADVPAITGSDTAVVCLLACAMFGLSPYLVLGREGPVPGVCPPCGTVAVP